MGLGRRILLCGIAGIFVCSNASAGAGPKASDKPRVSGPLTESNWTCESLGSPRGPSSGHADVEVCTGTYELSPAAEPDADEDFSGYWVQIHADPVEGWCMRRIGFGLSFDDGHRVVSATHEGRSRLRGEDTLVILQVGGDAPLLQGSIAQEAPTAPGRTSARLDDHSYEYEWRGRSADPVFIAVGVEVAQRMVPPQLFYGQGGGFADMSSPCRKAR